MCSCRRPERCSLGWGYLTHRKVILHLPCFSKRLSVRDSESTSQRLSLELRLIRRNLWRHQTDSKVQWPWSIRNSEESQNGSVSVMREPPNTSILTCRPVFCSPHDHRNDLSSYAK